MRLLFDQNLSFKLCNILEKQFPGSNHVGLIGLSQAADQAVWEFARTHEYTIVSQDADFAEMAALIGVPPKVVWLRTGNLATMEIANLLMTHAETMRSFESDEAICLEIHL